MRVAGVVLRSALRRQAVALTGVALIVALGGGVALAALVAADRTGHAYPEYVGAAQVADLVINPSLATRSVDRAMHRLPGVGAVHSDFLFEASISHTGPARMRDFGDDADLLLQVRGSVDGRYAEADRPVVTAGRVATGHREVFVSEDERSALETTVGHRLEVGDSITLAFWWGLLEDAGLPADTKVAPIGVERLRIAGFGHLPDEVLPDELYSRKRMIVSPDVTRRYICEADFRADMTEAEATDAFVPTNCSRTHRFYALRLLPGASKTAIHRAFTAITDRLAHDIPPTLASSGASYAYLAASRTDVDAAVRQVTRPTVASLVVFGLVAGLATIAVVGLAEWRLLLREDAQGRELRAMGATRAERTLCGAAPLLIAGAVGLAAAVAIALAASVIGPAGSVRAVAPSPGYSMPGRVVLPVVAALAAVLVLMTWALARSAAQRSAVMAGRRPRRARISRRSTSSGRPAVTQGLRAAFSARGSDGGGVVLAGAVVVLATIVSAVVFGANLTTLVAHPTRYGWPWDAAVITNGGYGSTDPVKVAATLDHDAVVDDYSLFAFDPSTPFGGRPVPTVFGFPGAERTSFPLIKGRQVRHPGEAMLGAATARDLHVSVGDRVPVRADVGRLRSVHVVGIGVLPSLGSFLAERAGLGTGALVLVDTDPAKPANQYPATLTAIRLRKGTDASAFVEKLRASPSWDTTGATPYAELTSVRPPAIVNADSMRIAPLVLAFVLALGLELGLVLSIGVSVRDRRRELAILRSLGFSGRDLRATIECQAIATMAVGVCVGVPLGVAAGRLAWRAFADQVGVVPSGDIPFAPLGAVGALVVVLGVLAALVPARAAARISPSVVLRESV